MEQKPISLIKEILEHFKIQATVQQISRTTIQLSNASVLSIIYVVEKTNNLGYLSALRIIGECSDKRLGIYEREVYPHQFQTVEDLFILVDKHIRTMIGEAAIAAEEQKWKDRQINLFDNLEQENTE